MKETRRKRLIRNNGITLIALVVTIVVLLILAGVSINLVIGQNGIITYAKTAKIETKAATVSDERDMWMNDRYLAKQIGETPKSMEEILAELEGRKILTADDVKTIKDDPNNKITIGSKTISFLIIEPQIGDYVDYTYDDAENYILTSAETGCSYNSEEGIPQSKDIKWRILNIDKDSNGNIINIDLVSETLVGTHIFLNGSSGYNNGVYLLNDICDKQYSNSNLGIVARSINIEDIEKQETEEGRRIRLLENKAEVTYGNTKTYTDSNSYYPSLYSKQKGSGINATTVKKDGISESDTTEAGYIMPTIEKYSQADTKVLTVTQTNYYHYTLNKDKYGDAASVLDIQEGSYWLASRYTNCKPNYATFGLRRGNDSWYDDWMFASYNYTGNGGYGGRLRPVVSISEDMISGKDADGVWQIRTN